MGDFSNGNDAIILKNKADLAAIKGQKINLVEFSVSHYLLARALETKHLAEKDIKVVNTSDADMAAAYKTAEVTAVVTWNPIVAEILGSPDAKKVFDSSQIPGEIMDLMVVNTAVLKDNPEFAKALVGIWYETIAKMNEAGAPGKEAKEAMAKASGTDLAGFDSQLASTKLFDTAPAAVAFTESKTVASTMDRVRKFLFEKALLGKEIRRRHRHRVRRQDRAGRQGQHQTALRRHLHGCRREGEAVGTGVNDCEGNHRAPHEHQAEPADAVLSGRAAVPPAGDRLFRGLEHQAHGKSQR
jgi:NitT/TauT family transport system substrate-binding protein